MASDDKVGKIEDEILQGLQASLDGAEPRTTYSREFLLAFETVLKFEGQTFVKDPNDPGCWTGGQVGQGELKGSKFGISAKSYPTLDIEHLSVEDAKAIYFPDYWLQIRGQELGQVATVIFDSSVHHGVFWATETLQRILLVTVDGIIGPKTLAALSSRIQSASSKDFCVDYLSCRLDYMASLRTWPNYALGWSRRIMTLAIFYT